MICRDTPTNGSVCGWMGGSVGQWVTLGQSTKNLINLDLMGQWVNGWGQVILLKIK